jgi:hypothetical protein
MLAMSEVEKHIKDEMLQLAARLAAEIGKEAALEWVEQILVDLNELPPLAYANLSEKFAH